MESPKSVTVTDGNISQQVPEMRDEASASPILDDLITRAQKLTNELEAFRDRLRDLRQEGNVELGHYRSTLQSEMKMLGRLSQDTVTESTKVDHVAKSSNLPFLETVWGVVKGSANVMAMQNRIYLTPGVKQKSQGMRHVDINGTRKRTKGCKERAVVVDAVVDSGRTWIKVSLVTNQRLMFDLAKQGWDSGGSDDEFADEVDLLPADQDRDVPILKTAKDLTKASRCFRAKTKMPTVNIILPRVQLGQTPEVDKIIHDCRATGAIVHCGESHRPALPLDESFKTMAPDPTASFTGVLNIDCTILLALVSEFSHAKVSKEPWFHAALRRQVEIEDNENLLPSLLYPAMGSHKLVCTEEAVKRMREIVSTIGTPSEKARTAILLGDTKAAQPQLIQEMQEWSAYQVPPDWQLPISVVNQNENDCQSGLPSEALRASAEMTDINRSVFLYGWASGRTTITSNRTVVKALEANLEKTNDLDDDVWPRIWLCPTARSLVGKEKRGAKKIDGKDGGAWPLPDPLRREEQRRNGLDVLSLRNGFEVEDLRPGGYPCAEVLAAKNASLR